MREKRGNLLQTLAMATLIGIAGCQSPVPTTQTAESTQVNSEARAKAEAKRAEFASRYNLLSNSCFELQGQGDSYNGMGFVDSVPSGEHTVCQIGYDSDGYPVKVIEVRNCAEKTVDWYEFYSGNEPRSQWWHIGGVWLWYGCPPKTTPTPVPTPTPTPSDLTLKLESPAFSPNGDGVKDSNLVTVNAQGSWTIEVDGHPGTVDTGPGPNSDSKSFPWDGTVSGIILPDGKYTLRLTAGSEVKTAEVIIDIAAPIITESRVPTVDEHSENEKAVFTYTFDCKAEDQNGASGSLVDPKSMQVAFKNATFTSPVITESTDAGVYRVKADYVSAPRSSKTLKYEVVISDNAGNTSKPYDAGFSCTDVEQFVMSGGFSSSTGNAYQLLARSFPKKALKNDFVFYVRSGLVGEAEYRFYSLDSLGKAVSGTRDVFIVNASTGKDYKKFNAKFGLGFTATRFDWNGQEYNETVADGKPKVAPTGRYVVSIYKGNEFKQSSDRLADVLPPWNKGKIRIEIDRDAFKVSDKEVLRLEDWGGLSPAYQTLNDALHTCIRHIVTNPAAGGALGPARFFGHYDIALSETPSPSWPWTYTPPTYNENREKNNGYPITRFLMRRPAYTSTLKIAKGLWAKGKQEPGDDINARFMPVILPTKGDVLWVRAILNAGSMTTVYPFVTDYSAPTGATILGQRTYEANIQ